MALSFTTTQAGASADYLRYLSGKPVKDDRINEPTLLDFSLIPLDGSFVRLVRGAYITIDTVTYPKWFTGFVTNDPQLEYLGTHNHVPKWGYRYEATDDSYLLNLKPLGLLPPFVNTSCGAIIRALVERLDPSAFFDLRGVLDGIRLSRYIVDPNKRFTEVVKELADLSAFRFRAHDKALYFEEKDATAAALTINGNSKHFTPSRLELRPALESVVNDAIVLGSVEPQGYINEYFVGDGFTGAFPLLSGMFGVNGAVLLDDDFSGSSINSQVWAEFDTVNDWIKPVNGYLNVVGGSNDNSFDVYLQSVNLVALEGTVRITHGQYDFVNSASTGVNGVVGGLWTQAPSSAYTGCVYGIEVSKASGTTKLKPILNGTVDGTKELTVDFSKRYVIRTLCNFERSNRQQTAFAFVDQSGANGTYGGNSAADVAVFKTWIAVIDPSTGEVVSTTEWQNSDVAIGSNDAFAYYNPVVSNDLHCSVTGITISIPLLASLEIKPDGGSYGQKLIGPNEVDSLDGLAPVATVTSDGGGVSQSVLGSPKYNPGNATLVFFKDTTKQVSYIPAAKSLVHLRYRRAGVSLARVQNMANIVTEASGWGDGGLRSITRLDLSPLPRTSEECELAAAAVLKEFGFQHYEGRYTQFHTHEFTGHPLSGTVLTFTNLPSLLPSSLQAEVIHQVRTTFHCGVRELFEHEVMFGKQEYVQKVLSKFASSSDVLGALDAVDMPSAAALSSVGTTFVSDVTAPYLVSWDASNLNFDAGQSAPSGGGFEVRYTDEGWGADDGRNLITRTSGTTFSVPRTARGKICFVKAYDARNKVLYSEDLTQSAWVKTNVTASIASDTNPDGNTSLVSSAQVTSAGGSVYQQTGVSAASVQAVVSVSVKGTPGKQVKLQLADGAGAVLAETTITLSSAWRRYSVTGTFGGGASGNIRLYVTSVSGSGTHTFQMTRASVETGRSTESGYFKTNSTVFGAMSRYAAGIRVSFPMVPPAPTASVDYTDAANPVLSITLPSVLQDVWGVEIRASNNSTVLYKQDLTDAGYSPKFIHAGNATRSLSYYVYTYNLLGEYSSGYNLTGTIPTPSLSAGPTVDTPNGVVKWTGANATKYLVEVDRTDNTFANIVLTKTVTDQLFLLSDPVFNSGTRYVRVTPQDGVGSGTPGTTSVTSRSTSLNGQGSVLPVPGTASPFSYSSGDGSATFTPYIRWTWSAITLYRPDGSTISIPASSSYATPGTPTLGTTAGGSKGSRTYYVRVAYVKDGLLRGISAEASQLVGANNLLTITAPAAQAGMDGWIPLIGTVTGGNYPLTDATIAFGVNYTESTGALSSAGVAYSAWGAQTGAVAFRTGSSGSTNLSHSTTYRFYPSWDGTTVRFNGGTNPSTVSPATSALMYQDGHSALAAASGMTAATPSNGGSGSGGGGGCVKEGTVIEPLGQDALVLGAPWDTWCEIRLKDGRVLTGTPDHPVILEHFGRTALSQVLPGDSVVTNKGAVVVVEQRTYREPSRKLIVTMPEGHLFWANGILSHNLKM